MEQHTVHVHISISWANKLWV